MPGRTNPGAAWRLKKRREPGWEITERVCRRQGPTLARVSLHPGGNISRRPLLLRDVGFLREKLFGADRRSTIGTLLDDPEGLRTVLGYIDGIVGVQVAGLLHRSDGALDFKYGMTALVIVHGMLHQFTFPRNGCQIIWTMVLIS